LRIDGLCGNVLARRGVCAGPDNRGGREGYDEDAASAPMRPPSDTCFLHREPHSSLRSMSDGDKKAAA
jgi:hypothetical protein